MKQYFKSIEKVAEKFGIPQSIPIAVQMGTRVADAQLSSSGLAGETRERQDSASAELSAISKDMKLAPPVQLPSRAVTPELFPDNMASRVPAFIERSRSPELADLSFDKMSSRIRGTELAV